MKEIPMNVKTSFLKNKIYENSPNKNIVPVTTTIDNDQKLFIGGCSIDDLVRKYDSPLYSSAASDVYKRQLLCYPSY